MRDVSQVLEQKKMELESVRREIEALHFVIPLLAEDADWIEHGLASPVSQYRRVDLQARKGGPEPKSSRGVLSLNLVRDFSRRQA